MQYCEDNCICKRNVSDLSVPVVSVSGEGGGGGAAATTDCC